MKDLIGIGDCHVCNDITFQQDNVGISILELKGNGDILVKGKLIENDIEVVDALREFLYTGKKKGDI